jgi:hypothetical protein
MANLQLCQLFRCTAQLACPKAPTAVAVRFDPLVMRLNDAPCPPFTSHGASITLQQGGERRQATMPAPSDAVIDQMTAGFQDAAKTASTSALKSEAAKWRGEGEAFLGVHLAERDGQAERRLMTPT